MSPLREALAQLVGKGLVIQDGQRGFRVAPVSSDDLLDVMRTRGRLETMALKLAIENGEADWEAIILAAHRQLARRARTKDLLIDETWETLHREFHFSLIAACGSSRLLSFCDGDLRSFRSLSPHRRAAGAASSVAFLKSSRHRRCRPRQKGRRGGVACCWRTSRRAPPRSPFSWVWKGPAVRRAWLVRKARAHRLQRCPYGGASRKVQRGARTRDEFTSSF